MVPVITTERACLGVAYSSLGIALYLTTRHDERTRLAASAFLSTLWLGFVLAISLTEAWIKFRAPFLARHLGLDVGRHVFGALNAVEIGLALGLWLLQSDMWWDASTPLPLVLNTAILGTQTAYLYPTLVLSGEFAISEALNSTPERSLPPRQKAELFKIQKSVGQNKRPSKRLHVVYVAAELLKAALLARLAFEQLRQLV
ncbi:hypothetical protein PINS_up011197 [Pythium insidiosum]|nr:hypothetical protein PINS_up011197 [Pythium insidiosum]